METGSAAQVSTNWLSRDYAFRFLIGTIPRSRRKRTLIRQSDRAPYAKLAAIVVIFSAAGWNLFMLVAAVVFDSQRLETPANWRQMGSSKPRDTYSSRSETLGDAAAARSNFYSRFLHSVTPRIYLADAYFAARKVARQWSPVFHLPNNCTVDFHFIPLAKIISRLSFSLFASCRAKCKSHVGTNSTSSIAQVEDRI